MRFLQYSLYLTEIAIFYDRVVRPASDLAHPSILKDSFTIARRDPSRKTAACLLRPQHPHRGARSDRGAPRARRRPHRALGAHRRDRGVSGAPRSRGALLPRPHRAHRSHVWAAGARIRVFHLRLLELSERGHRRGRCATRGAAARARAARGRHRPHLRSGAPVPRAAHRSASERRQSRRRGESDPRHQRSRLARTPRIGVDYAGEWARRPWRFLDRASAHVSA